MAKRYPPKMIRQDARQLDAVVKQQTVSVTITSPPYHDLKNYNSQGQIGYGQDYESYLYDLQGVFKKVFDATKEKGSLWVVIDTFKRNNELIVLPFDFAERLKDIGWKLRDLIVWKKERTLPWTKQGDTRRIFEYVLVFSKDSSSFKYRTDRGRDVEELKGWWVRYPERYNPKGKALEDIWSIDIPTQGSWSDGDLRHFCPLPGALIQRILQLTTDPGDTVLDPFAGSGSVLIESHVLGRRAIGLELNKDDVTSFKDRFKKEAPKIRKAATWRTKRPERFQQLIVSLRILKFARVLRKRLPRKLAADLKLVVAKKLTGRADQKHKIVRAFYALYAPALRESKAQFMERVRAVSSVPPLSKFGVEPTFRLVRDRAKLIRLLKSQRFYSYSQSNTHHHRGRVKKVTLGHEFQIISPIKINLNEQDYA